MNDIKLLNEIYYRDVNYQPEDGYHSLKEMIDKRLGPIIRSNTRDERTAKKTLETIFIIAQNLSRKNKDLVYAFLAQVESGTLSIDNINKMGQDVENIRKGKRDQ